MTAPTRYPLQWPEGWKRMQSDQRKTATFSRQGKALTVFDGVQRVLDGESDQRWREAIGNAVPRKSAKAIGTVMGQTILLAKNGETFVLGSTPIWVRPMVAALAVAREGGAA